MPRMSQRIRERGQIETLASRSIPRVRLPDRERVFARRAARLRERAHEHPLGDYLRLLAAVCDAQQAALARFVATPPAEALVARAREHGMPPLLATDWPRDPQWRAVLHDIAAAIGAIDGAPPAVAGLAQRLRAAEPDWLESQADALLALRDDAIDIAAAPFVMAALQVHWVALTASFDADRVMPLDVNGVCPLCGTAPVASLVATQAPYAGYRYLHCALCATEWHRVRVECTQCGANGKDIAYRSLTSHDADDAQAALRDPVRAETCDACHAYRKILYQEFDPAVEPVADDLATLTLDLLLGEAGYHRASGNPLFWQRAED